MACPTSTSRRCCRTPRPDIAGGRVIVAHLGSGASLCALKNGKSVDSTLGFTALDGLCMGTRPGALDPGVVLYLFQSLGLSAAEVETMLYKKSGLLAISGISNDMRDLLGNTRARGQAGGRLLRLSRRQGDRRARRRPRRPRRPGLHRRHRRELVGDPPADLRGVGLARHRARPRRERHRTRPAHLPRRQSGVGVGDPDQRRTDDRPPHGPAAGTGRRPARSGPVSKEHNMAGTASASKTADTAHLALAGVSKGPLAGRDQRPRLHPAELHALRRGRVVPGAGDRAHAAASGRRSRRCSSRSGRRACSTSRRFPARSRRTRPATSIATTRSSSACRPRRRSSARSCRTAASGWWPTR